jgi:hypothetical protein
MSANLFTTDSIVIKKEDIEAFGIRRVYIGVYTDSPLCVYSIVASYKTKFNPIQLTLGQIQQGIVRPHEKKFYYVEASGSSENPFRIDLIPTYGNPDLEITII